MIFIMLLALMLLTPSQAAAQDAPAYNESYEYSLPETDSLETIATKKRSWTSIEIVLSVGILMFSFAVLVLEAIIVIKAEKAWAPHSIMRVFGLTLILSMSVLLVVAGYDKDQIAPVMGLLGVIAGYLLGNSGERPQRSA